jgi:hypothetical protein
MRNLTSVIAVAYRCAKIRSVVGSSASRTASPSRLKASVVLGGLLALGRRPRRPMLVATLATLGFPLPPLTLALHAPAVTVAAAALLAGLGSALGGAIGTTVTQQRVPEDALARVGAFSMVGAFALGPVAFAAAGPVAAAVGARALLGFGAAWAAAGTAAVLCVPSVRRLTWLDAPDGAGHEAGISPGSAEFSATSAESIAENRSIGSPRRPQGRTP